MFNTEHLTLDLTAFLFYLACFKMIPVRIGLEKVFCGEQAFWQAGGHSSLYAVILGMI